MTKLSYVLAATAASLFLAVLANPAEAKSNKQTQVKVNVDQSIEISARRHRHSSRRSGRTHYAKRGGGSCDGIHRCRCGSTQASHFGLPRMYKGFNLWLAAEWGRAFPRTSFGIGVVGVKPHHVLRVVGGSDCHSATVSDDAGTRQRNVCGMTFVAVNGGETQHAAAELPRQRHTRTVSAERHHHHYAANASQRYAYDRRAVDGWMFTYAMDDGSYRGKYQSMRDRRMALVMQRYSAQSY
jgi:hypothetical protein